MNTNDFYKQLMSEYSFDSEKIKENAKKGKFARQKAIPMYIGMAAAAAVCTVAVGSAVAIGLNSRGGVELVSSEGRAWLPADERISKALEDIARNENSTEQREVLVSFAAGYSPEEVRNILTVYSNVSVRQIYFADGTKAVGENEVEAAFAGTNTMTGAVIKCEGALMKTLESDPRVLTVEEITEADLDVITPINNAAADTIEVTASDDIVPVPEFTPAVEETAQTKEPVQSDEENDGTEELDESEDGLDGTEEESEESTEQTQTAESAETESAVSEETVSTENEPATVPSEEVASPTVDETEQPTESVEEGQQEVVEPLPDMIPAGVVLPENPDVFSYDTFIYAENAFFLNDSVFFAKLENKIALYSYENGTESLVASEECEDAKICWVSEKGGRLMVSALGENGKRSKLFMVDANNGIITDLCAEDAVMDGTLAGVGYNESANILAINIKEEGKYYVCSAHLRDYSQIEYLSTCFESKARVTLLAANGNSIYVAATEGALTQIFRCDIAGSGYELIKTYDNSPAITKNLAFTHAVFAPSEYAVTGNIEIFDPVSESFIKTDFFNETLTFGSASHSFCASGESYSIRNGAVYAEESADIYAKIDYKKSGSAYFTAAVSSGKIKITKSAYGNTSGIVFGEFTDSAARELRTAADNAIALTNALALGKCSDCGIYSQTMLVETIKACFAQNAADSLKERCGISELGALRYNGTSLDMMRVCDTALVISAQNDTSAHGTLYIRKGTFCSKGGWLAYEVEFAKENGRWKMNTVIG